MLKVGFIGWRGMVGSVLLERMLAEGDFQQGYTPYFFTTSQAGQDGPDVGVPVRPLDDQYAADDVLGDSGHYPLVEHLYG